MLARNSIMRVRMCVFYLSVRACKFVSVYVLKPVFVYMNERDSVFVRVQEKTSKDSSDNKKLKRKLQARSKKKCLKKKKKKK